MATPQYYYLLDGQPQGPVPKSTLLPMIQSGQLPPSVQVCVVGDQQWVPADQHFTASKKSAAPPAVPPINDAGSPPQNANLGSSKPSQAFGIPVALFIGGICFVLVAIGIATIILVKSGDSNVPDAKAATDPDDAKDDPSETEELEDELKQLAEDVDDKTREKQILERKNQDLLREQRELEQKIDRLTSWIEQLEEFRTANFVLVSSEGGDALAIPLTTADDGQIRALGVARGELAEHTIAMSRNRGIARVDRADRLAGNIASDIAGGLFSIPDPLPDHFQRELEGFLPVEPFVPSEAEKFVALQRIGRRSGEIGLIQTIDQDSLTYLTTDGQSIHVDKSSVLMGSVRTWSDNDQQERDEVLSSLNGVGFLDYCVMGIAKAISPDSNNSRPTPINLAIDVHYVGETIEMPERYKPLSERTTLVTNNPDVAIIQAISDGFGNYFEAMRAERNQILRARTRAQIEKIVNSMGTLEEALYSKFQQLNVRTVDKSLFQDVRREHSNRVQGAANDTGNRHDWARRANATHVVLVDARPGLSDDESDAVLSVRLVDIVNPDSEVLWSATGNRLIPFVEKNRDFVLSTGSLHLVQFGDERPKDFRLVESPPVHVNKHATNSSTQLMWKEESDDPNVRLYRPLFSRRLQSIAAEHVIKETPINHTDPNVVPPEHLMRYLMWWTADKVMPPAGQIVKVNRDETNRPRTATISVPSGSDFKLNDRLRVLRTEDDGGSTYLPVEVHVTELGTGANSKRITIAIPRNGINDHWPEMSDIQVGDFVVPTRTRWTALRAGKPRILSPNARRPIARVIQRRPELRKQAEADFNKALETFNGQLKQGFTELKLPTRNANESVEGPIYQVVISIEPNDWDLSSVFLDLHADDATSNDKPKHSLKFDLPDKAIGINDHTDSR